jgi:hypothetical protein
MNGNPWHKDSRFWKFGGRMVLSTHVLALASMIWRPEHFGTAMGGVTAVTTAFIVAAGGANVAERWKPQPNMDERI